VLPRLAEATVRLISRSVRPAGRGGGEVVQDAGLAGFDGAAGRPEQAGVPVAFR